MRINLPHCRHARRNDEPSLKHHPPPVIPSGAFCVSPDRVYTCEMDGRAPFGYRLTESRTTAWAARAITFFFVQYIYAARVGGGGGLRVHGGTRDDESTLADKSHERGWSGALLGCAQRAQCTHTRECYTHLRVKTQCNRHVHVCCVCVCLIGYECKRGGTRCVCSVRCRESHFKLVIDIVNIFSRAEVLLLCADGQKIVYVRMKRIGDVRVQVEHEIKMAINADIFVLIISLR